MIESEDSEIDYPPTLFEHFEGEDLVGLHQYLIQRSQGKEPLYI